MDIAEAIIVAIDRMKGRLITDLLAVPEEKRNVSPGGAARTPLLIAAECGLINALVTARLTGGPTPKHIAFDQRDPFLATLGDTEAVVAYINEQTDALYAAIRAIDPATWDDMIELMPGRPLMSRFDVAFLPATHYAYHDGQLNFIHTLSGDTKRYT